MANEEVDVNGQQGPSLSVPVWGPIDCWNDQEHVPGYDRKHRWWGHLDTCRLTTCIHADVPGVGRPPWGRSGHNPLDEPGSQFTACAKGHRYLTVVTVLERNRVLYLTEGCKQESLDGF